MSQNAVRDLLEDALRALGIEDVEVHLERPKDPSHGDLATNVAMHLAARLKRSPRSIAEDIAGRIPTGVSGVDAVEVAGPGFLNFRISTQAVADALDQILEMDESFGASGEGGGEPVLVEFVSANPTGLLHLGHGRQAALGDAISSLLEFCGWAVQREFYYNDAGRQIERLAESLHARYQQHFGREAEVTEDGYQGEIVARLASELAETDGERWLGAPTQGALDRMGRFAVGRLREEQDRDLVRFGVHFDEYYLESSLYDDGRVESTLEALRESGVVYDKDGAVWLRSSQFGDQKDRVMIKSDGSATYFLPDVAYHVTKWERGFRRAINVQGADHHGTMARVRAGLRALGLPEGYPEYVLHQMVTVERGGREVKFSKRSGEYVTLRDLMEEVGVDVTRYFFLMRKADAHLVFDLDQALDQSDKNPVYKAKYAHARMCSIFRKAGLAQEEVTAGSAKLGLLRHGGERELIQQLAEFPEVVSRAAALRAPHLICEYLERTAGQVNSWYHAGNPTRTPELAVLVEDPDLRSARLALTRSSRIVLRNALGLLGLEAPERMEKRSDLEPDEN